MDGGSASWSSRTMNNLETSTPAFARNRYGREEFLALHTTAILSTGSGGAVQKVPQFFVEKSQEPVGLQPLSDIEQSLYHRGINSSTALSLAKHMERNIPASSEMENSSTPVITKTELPRAPGVGRGTIKNPPAVVSADFCQTPGSGKGRGLRTINQPPASSPVGMISLNSSIHVNAVGHPSSVEAANDGQNQTMQQHGVDLQTAPTHPSSLLPEVHKSSPSPVSNEKVDGRERWVYIDPEGEAQGPFDSKRMAEWFGLGYFTMQLQLRRAEESTFVTLGELIKKYRRVPFIAGPSSDTNQDSRTPSDHSRSRASSSTDEIIARPVSRYQDHLSPGCTETYSDQIGAGEKDTNENEASVRPGSSEYHSARSSCDLELMSLRSDTRLENYQGTDKANGVDAAQQLAMAKQMVRQTIEQRREQEEKEKEEAEAELRAAEEKRREHAEQLKQLQEQIRAEKARQRQMFEDARRAKEEEERQKQLQEEVEERRRRRLEEEEERRRRALEEEQRRQEELVNRQLDEERRMAAVFAEERRLKALREQEEAGQVPPMKPAPWTAYDYQQQPPPPPSAQSLKEILAEEERQVRAEKRQEMVFNMSRRQNVNQWFSGCGRGSTVRSGDSMTKRPGNEKSATFTDPFTKWCIQQLEILNSDVDAALVVEVLKEMESSKKIEEYVVSYFGDCRPVRDFLDAYLRRRNTSQQQSNVGPKVVSSGVAQMPVNDHMQNVTDERRGKKWTKPGKVIVDGSALGFKSTADSRRFNAGPIDRPF